MTTATATTTTSELHSRFPLSDAQIRKFRDEGFIKIPNFFSAATLEKYAPVISQLTFDLNPNKGKSLEQLGTYGRAFIQVGNLWEKDATVRELACCVRAAQAAAELMGADSIRMWHDQALYKEPGGGFTPWHADQQYWPFDTAHCVTIWIPLQETPMNMGPLAFAKGSHLKRIGRELEIGDESEKLIASEVKQQGLQEVYEPYALGEVSFHYGWTLHRAGPNTTTQPRRVFTVIYMDGQMKLTPRTPNHRNDWAAWTPSTHVGRVMDDPKNPVLYPVQ